MRYASSAIIHANDDSHSLLEIKQAFNLILKKFDILNLSKVSHSNDVKKKVFVGVVSQPQIKYIIFAVFCFNSF